MFCFCSLHAANPHSTCCQNNLPRAASHPHRCVNLVWLLLAEPPLLLPRPGLRALFSLSAPKYLRSDHFFCTNKSQTDAMPPLRHWRPEVEEADRRKEAMRVLLDPGDPGDRRLHLDRCLTCRNFLISTCEKIDGTLLSSAASSVSLSLG